MADGDITHDYISDSFRFSVDKYASSFHLCNRTFHPTQTTPADGSVVTDHVQLIGRSGEIADLLRTLVPQVTIEVDSRLNQLSLRGQPDDVQQALELLGELDRPESCLSTVEIRPVSGKAKAAAELEKSLAHYQSEKVTLTLSEDPGAPYDRRDYRGVAKMRPLGMTLECETNVAIGSIGSGESYVTYWMQAPVQDGDPGLLDRVLSSITFERPVTRKMRPQE